MPTESVKETLHILNSRDKKPIIKFINDHWGAEFKPDVMLMTNKKKVYIVSRGMETLDWQNLRVDKVGLYIGRFEKGFRPTIEGSEIIGKTAKKNILTIEEEETKLWFKGEDLNIPKDRTKEFQGFIIIKNKDDFLGSGKVTDRGVLNFVPKARRINMIQTA